MLTIAIYLSYALQFYVPVDIIWPSIRSRINNKQMHVVGEYGFRIALAIFTCEYGNMISFGKTMNFYWKSE